MKQSVACKRIDSEMDDDDLENIRHLYFEEKEGERDIQEEPTIETNLILSFQGV